MLGIFSRCKTPFPILDSEQQIYHFANVHSRDVRTSPNGPEETVHLPDGANLLLLVFLFWVFSTERHLQTFVCFTHRLHLRVLPQVQARVLQLLGAVCTYEAVKVPQNLQKQCKSTWDTTSLCILAANLSKGIFSYSCLSNNKGCFRAQGGKDTCHFHCNVTSTDDDAASGGKQIF